MKIGPYTLGYNDENQGIYMGDSQVLSQELPDESIDYIVTDPPYPRKYLHLYEWLAKEASRVLKPGGLCLAMSGHYHLPTVIDLMGKYLSYHWIFAIYLPGPKNSVFPRKILASWKPVLSFSKGKYTGPWWVKDIFFSPARESGLHIWQQSVAMMEWFVCRLPPDSIILDPFCGSGTTCVASRMNNRTYLSFDNDEVAVHTARERLKTVQPYPIMVEYEQPMIGNLL